jgi:rhodanese-related sulfurtransferase
MGIIIIRWYFIQLGKCPINFSLSRRHDKLIKLIGHQDNAMKHSEGFLKLVNDAKSRIREVSVEQTQQRMKENPNAKLIDVREDNEWQVGHAAGAEHLGKGVIERDIEQQVPDKSTEVILYCGGGYRSALAADVLQQMGYTSVFSMAGGWKAWKESGAETEVG